MTAARALWQRNEVDRAEAMLRELHAREPAREDAATLFAEVLRSQGRLSAASRVMLALCRAQAFDPMVCLRAARFARQCDRHAIAREICEGAGSQPQVPVGLLILAGHIARESGDFALARSYYLAALDAGVDLGGSHVCGALANTKRYQDPSDPDLARFERQFRDNASSPRARASAGFGLAKAWGDLGEYPAAARALQDSNAWVRSVQPWDAGQWRDFVARCQCERVPAASPDPQESRQFVPVFIVGVPRTGTTVTASLLAKTSPVRDRGELRTLRFIARQLRAVGRLGSPAALAEAARVYRKLAVQDDAPAIWYLDQDPLNFRYLDIATAMFPQARVVHLRRDRRDTALSLWGQDFARSDLGFAYDFDAMAGYLAGHDTLMRYWQDHLPVPIHELDYEALVADPDSALAALRDFIGAPARAPGPEPNAAPVLSASVWQARQPIYTTSVGRWRHYAEHVPELARFG
jgi:tetratricopeptide (TPR) repeat protein